MTRSRSWMPDAVGSVTMIASEVPVSDEITGQPIPGGPSIRMRDNPKRSACALASVLTMVTSFPEFSSPGNNSA